MDHAGRYIVDVVFSILFVKFFVSFMVPIILASQSPRRKLLLEWAEVSFDIVVVPTAETIPAGVPVEEVPQQIAKEKALAVVEQLKKTGRQDAIILAADTVVVLDNKIIGKPADRDAAVQTLQELSGRTHKVITGVCLYKAGKEICFAEQTLVSFYELSQEQIAFYVDQYKPYDKAGAYAIQEWIGVVGIQSIEGDFYNVMGLPVSRVLKALNDF